MSREHSFATFALRLGSAKIFFAEGIRGRVGSTERAAQFESREAAGRRAAELGMGFPWVAVQVPTSGGDDVRPRPGIPSADPMTTLLLVRRAIPSKGPLKEDVLRSLRPELDRIAAELRRARRRRCTVDALEAAA